MAGFAATKQTNPRPEQPASDKAAEENKDRFPNNHRDQSVGDGATNDGIRRRKKEKVDPANEEKPAETAQIVSDEFVMSANRFTQGFVVERKRNLHRTEGNNQSAHDHALDWKIIKHVGNVHEVSEQQRKSHNERADEHDDAGPFQNVTESPHSKAEQLAFLKTQTANPSKTNRDQINLNVNAEEIL